MSESPRSGGVSSGPNRADRPVLGRDRDGGGRRRQESPSLWDHSQASRPTLRGWPVPAPTGPPHTRTGSGREQPTRRAVSDDRPTGGDAEAASKRAASTKERIARDENLV